MSNPGSPFAWSDDYATGIQEIDSQHRVLLDLVGQLAAALSEGRGRQEIGHVLHRLVGYTQEHFAFEEALMGRHDFPGAELHQDEHQALTASVQGFVAQAVAGSASASPVKILSFLMDWAVEHIQGTDRRLGEFLRTQGLS